MSLETIDHDLLLSSILKTAPSAIVVMDAGGTVLDFSPAGETMFGWRHDEIEGRDVSLLMAGEDALRHGDHVRRYLRTGEGRIIGKPRTMQARRKDGAQLSIRLSVGEFFQDGDRYFVGFMEDVTALADARRRLARAERSLDRLSRLSSMATVASAIAHDLNQPLSAATKLVEATDLLLAKGGAGPDDPPRRHLAKASEEIRRAGSIVQRVRAMIERNEPERRYTDFGEAVREACLIATGGAVEEGIGLDLDLADDLPPVLMDRVQIQQVVVNLMRNALDALAETDRGGRIAVTTRLAGETAVLTIADNGPGVPAGVVDALFEPFVTTKSSGLGMGLAIARSLVDAHGGELVLVETGPGGTVMRLALPVRGEWQDEPQ